AAAAAPGVAALIGPELGWDHARLASESTSYADAVHAALRRAGLDADVRRAAAATGRGSDHG
ncbi:MAG: hypothetical protein WB565_15335, partial [Acidimicrobiales bacterium]